MSVKKQTAIVTGGAQGIGKGITTHLIAKGWLVAAMDTDTEALVELAAEFPGDNLLTLIGDVADEDAVKSCVDKAFETFGHITALVNNAGISTGFGKNIQEISLADWNRVIGVNLTGTFLMSKHCASHLEASKGAIVNISSTRALMSEKNTEAYSASKGGIVALTHALAVSLGPEVRVNCISPGWIETGEWQKQEKRRVPHHSDLDRNQHPVGRVGKPEDIAELAEFLLSDKSGFITGQNFPVDGGMTIKMIYEE
ncbi:MAG: glucose 1-dehydrogenase [Planctomycetes bacterium]|nr:glucose 1-dehydrogenase [Planctomycetota bacterium]